MTKVEYKVVQASSASELENRLNSDFQEGGWVIQHLCGSDTGLFVILIREVSNKKTPPGYKSLI
jgi:hypothetical protein